MTTVKAPQMRVSLDAADSTIGLDPDQLVVRLAGEGLRIASAREFSTTQEIPRAVRISIGGSLDDTELVSAISRINHALTLPSAGAAI